MPKRFKNPLSSIANQFGVTVDSVLQPDFEFHLGHVERVFHNEETAHAHIGTVSADGASSPSQLIMISSTTGILPSRRDNFTARPLLRGVSDSITRGDLVLYTSIAGKSFYLGPLNTNNNPNYSPDHTHKSTNPFDDKAGYSIGYKSQKLSSPLDKKLKKQTILALDIDKDIPFNSELDLESRTTDMTIEGRHGNSIRFGSRKKSPQTIISNKRWSDVESALDGSNISMLSVGSLIQNLKGYGQDEDSSVILPLSCDAVLDENNPRKLLINYGNDPLPAEEGLFEDKFDYLYGDPTITDNNIQIYDKDKSNQMILFSDRIVFDAKRWDLTFSAKRNINLGAGKNFTLTNRGFTVIETNNIYLGREAKKRTEPMVLGSELKTLLIHILEWLKTAHAMTQAGPQPLIDVGMTPLNASKLSGFSLDDILEELNKEYKPEVNDDDKKSPIPISDRSTGGPSFFSNHHFIEPNRS